MDNNETTIGRCLTIIKHTSEFPKLVRVTIADLLSDENNDLARKFIDAMNREASASSSNLPTTSRETVRLFHVMLLDETDELKVEEEEDTQLEGDEEEEVIDDDDDDIISSTSPFVRKIYSILNNDEDEMKIPVCVRNAIESDIALKNSTERFCDKVAGCVYDLFYQYDEETFFPCRLDSNRDTEKEIESVINFFPHLLSIISYDLTTSGSLAYAVTRAAMTMNTINHRSCNIKSVLFVPVLAKLELLRKLGSSVDRGGLLSYNRNDMNTLRYLATSGSCRCCFSPSDNTTSESDNNNQSINNQTLVATSTTQSSDETNNKTDYCSYSEEDYIQHQIHVDETNLSVIKKLREQNLFYKEDIQREDLMECLLCCKNNTDFDINDYIGHVTDDDIDIDNDNDNDNDNDIDNDNDNDDHSSGFYFAEKRFRYLVDWDPISLTKERNNQVDGLLPLHLSVMKTFNINIHKKKKRKNKNNIRHDAAVSGLRGFRTVLDAGIRHYPTKVGFLFHKDINNDRTPFQMACNKYGKEAVMQIVDDVVIIGDNYNNTVTSSTSTFMETLITAAIDETIHLDCIFFLLRKEPSIFLQTSSYVSSNEDRDKCNPVGSTTTTKMAMITNNQQQKRKREIISCNTGKGEERCENDEHGHGVRNHKWKTPR